MLCFEACGFIDRDLKPKTKNAMPLANTALLIDDDESVLEGAEQVPRSIRNIRLYTAGTFPKGLAIYGLHPGLQEIIIDCHLGGARATSDGFIETIRRTFHQTLVATTSDRVQRERMLAEGCHFFIEKERLLEHLTAFAKGPAVLVAHTPHWDKWRTALGKEIRALQIRPVVDIIPVVREGIIQALSEHGKCFKLLVLREEDLIPPNGVRYLGSEEGDPSFLERIRDAGFKGRVLVTYAGAEAKIVKKDFASVFKFAHREEVAQILEKDAELRAFLTT